MTIPGQHYKGHTRDQDHTQHNAAMQTVNGESVQLTSADLSACRDDKHVGTGGSSG